MALKVDVVVEVLSVVEVSDLGALLGCTREQRHCFLEEGLEVRLSGGDSVCKGSDCS